MYNFYPREPLKSVLKLFNPSPHPADLSVGVWVWIKGFFAILGLQRRQNLPKHQFPQSCSGVSDRWWVCPWCCDLVTKQVLNPSPAGVEVDSGPLLPPFTGLKVLCHLPGCQKGAGCGRWNSLGKLLAFSKMGWKNTCRCRECQRLCCSFCVTGLGLSLAAFQHQVWILNNFK